MAEQWYPECTNSSNTRSSDDSNDSSKEEQAQHQLPKVTNSGADLRDRRPKDFRHRRSHSNKKPYELDKALCLDKLSLESETCTKPSCMCCHPKKRRRFVFSVDGPVGRQVILQPPRSTSAATGPSLVKQPRLILRDVASSTATKTGGPQFANPSTFGYRCESRASRFPSPSPGPVIPSESGPSPSFRGSGVVPFASAASQIGATGASLPTLRSTQAYVSDGKSSPQGGLSPAEQPDSPHISPELAAASSGINAEAIGCAQQARQAEEDGYCDYTMDELACYFDEYVHIPKKMSSMAEMMYG